MSGDHLAESSGSSEEEDGDDTIPMKLVVVARRDLEMSPGKLAAQVGHGVHMAMDKTKRAQLKRWDDDGAAIVVLEVPGFADLKRLKALAKQHGVRARAVEDEGLTEVRSGSWTVLAVGPDESARVDLVTGQLRLYGSGPAEASAGEASGEAACERCAKLEAEIRELRSRLEP
mmetsp:Transcript_103169/g.300888  ORF Transcript_103169/g.300888 Transcript_103169/m.300888 type:complete len:173 (+) Transcript_103169:62-580(+)